MFGKSPWKFCTFTVSKQTTNFNVWYQYKCLVMGLCVHAVHLNVFTILQKVLCVADLEYSTHGCSINWLFLLIFSQLKTYLVFITYYWGYSTMKLYLPHCRGAKESCLFSCVRIWISRFIIYSIDLFIYLFIHFCLFLLEEASNWCII